MRLEERLSVMADHVSGLRRSVHELREERAAARAVAREASGRAARLLAGGGLLLTTLNVLLSVWLGVH